MPTLNKLSPSRLPKLGEGNYGDGGNLIFKVVGNTRRWVFRYKVKAGLPNAGKPKELALGTYPANSLAEVRAKASAMRDSLATGGDPAHILKPPALPVAPVVKTFEDYAQDFLAKNPRNWKREKQGVAFIRTLERHAYPHIGAMPPAAITPKDIETVLSPIWTKIPRMATKLVRWIGAILDHAYYLEGIDKANPARWTGGLKNVFPTAGQVKEEKHFAAAKYQDCPALYKTLRERGTVTAQAFCFTMLTASRSMNVRDARFADIDLDAKIWSIPSENMKSSRPHTVPLCSEAIDIIKEQLAKHPRSERIFPGQNGGLLSDVGINKAIDGILDYKITAHGTAKSSISDWGAEQTNFPEAAFRALRAHKNRDRVEAAYLRSEYFDIRVKIHDDWQVFLLS